MHMESAIAMRFINNNNAILPRKYVHIIEKLREGIKRSLRIPNYLCKYMDLVQVTHKFRTLSRREETTGKHKNETSSGDEGLKKTASLTLQLWSV